MHKSARQEKLKVQNYLRGATTVELALVVPIIILLLLGVIEFSRYSTARGIAESAAQQAASLASYVPNLDNEGGITILNEAKYNPDGSSTDQCSGAAGDDPCVLQQAALQKVIDKLTQIAASAGLTLQSEGTRITSYAITLPSDPTRPLVDTLSQKPIEIMLKGEFVPLVPGLEKIPFTVKALTFREIRKGSTMPVDPPSCGTSCRCPNRGPEWRLDPVNPGGPCICVAGMHQDSNGTCVCDIPEQRFIQSTRSCGCTNVCTANQYLSSNCTCTACPNGTTLSQGQCLCPSGGVADPNNPTYPCGCNADEYMCTNSGNLRNGQCVSRTCSNPDTMVFDESSCKCVCKSVTLSTGKPRYVQCAGEDSCRDVASCNGNSNQNFNTVSCSCNCGNAAKPQQCGQGNTRCMAPCRDGATTDLPNCACNCPTPKVYNYSSGSCVCPSGNGWKTCTPGGLGADDGVTDGGTSGGLGFNWGTDDAMAAWSDALAANSELGAGPSTGVGGSPGGPQVCVQCDGGSLNQACGCVCPQGKTLCGGACIQCVGGTVNPSTCQCTCSGGSLLCDNRTTCLSCSSPKTPDILGCSCICPECTIQGAVQDPNTCACSCPTGEYQCGSKCVPNSRPTNCNANFGTWDETNCTCQCGANSTPVPGGGCACNSGYVRCGNNCVPAPTGSTDAGNCNYTCPAGTQACLGACVSTTCQIPNQAFVCSATGPACVCDLQCGAGKGNYFNPATQQCECICSNSNQELLNGICVDKCTGGKIRDVAGSCVCPSGDGKGTCTNGNCLDCSAGPKTVLNLSACSCECSQVNCGAGKTQNLNSCGCECTSGCPTPLSTGTAMSQNATTCQCSCLSGKEQCQNGCYDPCPQGKSRNSTTCECLCPQCPPAQFPNNDGTCGCHCPVGLYPYNGGCVPPNCASGYCPGTPSGGGYGG